VQRAVLYGWTDSASRPAIYVFIQSAGSMRSASFHFTMRSKRANKPTLNRPVFQPMPLGRPHLIAIDHSLLLRSCW
jgi:hypothetical protein